MNRKLLLALLLGSLLACATITRAEDAEVDDDDEEDDVEERAYLLVRRKGERPPVMEAFGRSSQAPTLRICGVSSATRATPMLRRQQPAFNQHWRPLMPPPARPHSDRCRCRRRCLCSLPAVADERPLEGKQTSVTISIYNAGNTE
jgi:hypothetical protein